MLKFLAGTVTGVILTIAGLAVWLRCEDKHADCSNEDILKLVQQQLTVSAEPSVPSYDENQNGVEFD